MMVFCIKNNGENKTRVKRKNKTSRKTNKTNVKTQQNQLGAVLDVPLHVKGRKRTFFLGKNVNRIEDAFLENFSANRRPSACLSSYKSEMPLILTIPANFQLSSYTCLSDKS